MSDFPLIQVPIQQRSLYFRVVVFTIFIPIYIISHNRRIQGILYTLISFVFYFNNLPHYIHTYIFITYLIHVYISHSCICYLRYIYRCKLTPSCYIYLNYPIYTYKISDLVGNSFFFQVSLYRFITFEFNLAIFYETVRFLSFFFPLSYVSSFCLLFVILSS